MRTKRLFTYGICVLLVALVVGVNVLPAFADAMGGDEYEVFAAVVGLWEKDRSCGGNVVLRQATSTREKLDDRAVAHLQQEWKTDIEVGMAAQFNARNAASSLIEDRFPQLHVTLFTDEERTALFSGSGDGWKAFYQKYPRSGGYIEMSRPAFDREHKVAILYYATHSDWLAATGEMLLFVRDGKGEWMLKARYLRWIS